MVDRNPLPDNASPDEPAPPVRQVDASAMKAFAHPLRMAMYDYLSDHEAATATMLAKHTGESTGQTSYHLRQLERHGFVEEDSGRGTGRERWWRSVSFRMDGTKLAQDSATRPAVEAMLQHQMDKRVQTVKEWYLRAESEPAEWVAASVENTHTATMNVEEAAALTRALLALIDEHADRAKARRAENGDDEQDRRVRVFLDVLPLPTD